MVTDNDFFTWLTEYLLDKQPKEAEEITKNLNHLFNAWKNADTLNKRHIQNMILERRDKEEMFKLDTIKENLMLRAKLKDTEERDMEGYTMPPKEEIKEFLIKVIERGEELHSYVYNDTINTLEDIQRYYPFLYKSEIADFLDKARRKHDI